MIQAKLFSQHCGRIGLRILIALAAMLILQPKVGITAQTGYESIPVLSASKILPPELLTGPNHRVQERVTNDGFLNIYTIDSPFGQFKAVSTAMLRIRIQEINAIAALDKLKGTTEYGKAVKESALGVSNVSAIGKVYFLKKVSDFSGNYFATQATFAVAGGGGELVMANGNGVFIAVQSEQSGTRLTAGASGVSLKLK